MAQLNKLVETKRGRPREKPASSSPSPPDKVERRRKSRVIPGGDKTGGPARTTEPSEDFAERRDIETADEPVEQHDRRHHDRGPDDTNPGQRA